MSENTKIEWATHTFNPWEGCTKVGAGCDHCYAEVRNARYAGGQSINWGAGAPRRRTSEANWKLPIKWNKEADAFFAEHGHRQRVFCASLADVFDNEVNPQWRHDLFELIKSTPKLDWLLLTKRIGNVEKLVDKNIFWKLDNVWLGITVVNQLEVDRDITKLMNIPAKVRFLSIEPLLESVSLRWLAAWPENSPNTAQSFEEVTEQFDGLRRLHWVIVGGESGSNARPMHPDWARKLRDQCAAADVPFMFKQWGEWEVHSIENGHHDCDMSRNGAIWLDVVGKIQSPSSIGLSDKTYAMIKVGKKKAGRLLDGVTHDGVPQ